MKTDPDTLCDTADLVIAHLAKHKLGGTVIVPEALVKRLAEVSPASDRDTYEAVCFLIRLGILLPAGPSHQSRRGGEKH